MVPASSRTAAKPIIAINASRGSEAVAQELPATPANSVAMRRVTWATRMAIPDLPASPSRPAIGALIAPLMLASANTAMPTAPNPNGGAASGSATRLQNALNAAKLAAADSARRRSIGSSRHRVAREPTRTR